MDDGDKKYILFKENECCQVKVKFPFTFINNFSVSVKGHFICIKTEEFYISILLYSYVDSL